MNKVYLKRFFKNQSIEELRNKYVEYNDCYLISNNYSIVLLNSDYGLLEKSDNKYENFITSCFKKFDKYNESDINIINDLDECEEEYNIPSELLERKECKYGINLKLYNIIKNLIKADEVNILTVYNYSFEVIIRIRNTKTNEVGYLLPMKVY